MSSKAGEDRDKEDRVLPSDAAVIKSLLASMGVADYEPRVVQQLLNFMYRHVADILQDAEAYRQRMSTPGEEVSMEDLLLAIQARESFSFVQPPSQSVLTELANRRNKQPLPELTAKPGLQIPVNSLTGPSYQLTVPSDTSLPSAPAGPSGPSPAEVESGSTLRGGGKGQLPIQIKISNDQQKPSDMEWTDAG